MTGTAPAATARRRPRLTLTLVILMPLVYLAELSVPGVLGGMIYAPLTLWFEPWRVLTSGFLHSPENPMHLVLNVVGLGLLGWVMEPVLGRWRMLTVFLGSIVGGFLAASPFIEPTTFILGASGGIFGLVGAVIAVQLRDRRPVLIWIAAAAVDLALGFLIASASWQAHAGGLVTGLVIATVLGKPRLRSPAADVRTHGHPKPHPHSTSEESQWPTLSPPAP